VVTERVLKHAPSNARGSELFEPFESCHACALKLGNNLALVRGMSVTLGYVTLGLSEVRLKAISVLQKQDVT
jgi:hypothetical protein